MKEEMKSVYHNLPPIAPKQTAAVTDTSLLETTPPPKKYSRAGSKRTSLLSSLTASNENSFETPANLSVEGRKEEEFKTPEVLKQPRKRIKLVTGQALAVRQEAAAAASGTDRAREALISYSARLKIELSTEEYVQFRRIMADFKSGGSTDIVGLVEGACGLFLPEHKDLLLGFRVFIKSRDHAQFDRIVTDRLKR
eukprot:sb/3470891/